MSKKLELPEEFVHQLDMACDIIHDCAKNKGWWEEKKNRNKAEMLMLVVTELAEATEALRSGNPFSDKIKGYSLLEEEMADAVIRIMDFCAGFNLRLAESISAKHNHNLRRKYKHGGKNF